MQLIFNDFKKGEVKISTKSLDDLWYLSGIIEKGDLVTGKTTRKIRIGNENSQKVIKKTITLTIEVEKTDFQNNVLRISGKTSSALEDIPKGSYHTLEVDDNTILKIEKEKWLKFQMEKLREACNTKLSSILICAIDREQATFALLTNSGYKILAELEGEVEKKGIENKNSRDFFSEIALDINSYSERYKINNIILASPAFWKEDLLKVIKKKYPNLKNITLATCNAQGKNAIDEVLKRDEVRTVLKQDRTLREMALIDELLKQISLDKNYAYGFEDILKASAVGAVLKLLITDELVKKMREKNDFDRLDSLMRDVDKKNGEIHIISVENEAGKKLKGLSGIAAILRFKLEY